MGEDTAAKTHNMVCNAFLEVTSLFYACACMHAFRITDDKMPHITLLPDKLQKISKFLWI